MANRNLSTLAKLAKVIFGLEGSQAGSKQLVRIPAWVELGLCTNTGKSPGQGVRMIYVSFLGDGWLGIPFGLCSLKLRWLSIAGPFHGKSSQVEKNKISNSAMKTSIYYFCIAYLIGSKTFFRIQ